MILLLGSLALAAVPFRHAAPVDADTLLLYTLYDEARAARLDLRDGELDPLDLSALSWPVGLAAGKTGLYALDRRGEAVWLLREVQDGWRSLGEVHGEATLVSRRGDAVLLTPGESGWSGYALEADDREALFEGLPHKPVDWGPGWLADEVAMRRDGEVWFWRAGQEPAPWAQPPPLWPATWPESWIALPDGTWLVSAPWVVHHLRGRGGGAGDAPRRRLPLPGRGLGPRGGHRLLRAGLFVG